MIFYYLNIYFNLKKKKGFFELKKLRKELHFYIGKDIAMKLRHIYFCSPIPIVLIYIFSRLLKKGTAPLKLLFIFTIVDIA